MKEVQHISSAWGVAGRRLLMIGAVVVVALGIGAIVVLGGGDEEPDHPAHDERQAGGEAQPTLHTVELPGGRSVQAFVDPGEPGANEVHATFFSADGGEEAVDDVEVAAESSHGERTILEPRMLAEGHLVASAELHAGTWAFRIEATAEDGTSLVAEFGQEVRS